MLLITLKSTCWCVLIVYSVTLSFAQLPSKEASQYSDPDSDPRQITNLKAAVHALVNCSAKTSFGSTKNILKNLSPLLKAPEVSENSDNLQTINDWGVRILSRGYSLQDLRNEDLEKSVVLTDEFNELVYNVTPVFQKHTNVEVPATLSVVDLEASSRVGFRFFNKDDHVELVSRVVAYKWTFHGDSYGIPFHTVRLGHNTNYDIEQIKEFNFESDAKMDCLQWNEAGVRWEKASGYCDLIETNQVYSECYCYDVREMSKKAIAVGLVGTPKKQEQEAEIVPDDANLLKQGEDYDNDKQEKEDDQLPKAEMLTGQRDSSAEDDSSYPENNKDKSEQIETEPKNYQGDGEIQTDPQLPMLNGKPFLQFDSRDQIPLFTKINKYMTESIREKAELVDDIRALEKKTLTYYLAEDTDVYGVKIAGTALNHLVSPKGVRFPVGAEREAGLQMSRQFLMNFMYTKTLEIGVAITDRDATSFSEALDDHLSLASDIVTISMHAPQDVDFSTDRLQKHVTILIPMTKGQKVMDPRCFRLDENNVLQQSGCTVERYEPSKFVECKCSSQFTRSFMIMDVAPVRLTETIIYNTESSSRSELTYSNTANPTKWTSKQKTSSKQLMDLTEGNDAVIVAVVLTAIVFFLTVVYSHMAKIHTAENQIRIEISRHSIVCVFVLLGCLLAALLIENNIMEILCMSLCLGSCASLGIWLLTLHARVCDQKLDFKTRHTLVIYMAGTVTAFSSFVSACLTNWSIQGPCVLVSMVVFFGLIFVALLTEYAKKHSKKAETPTQVDFDESDPKDATNVDDVLTVVNEVRKSKELEFDVVPSVTFNGSLDPNGYDTGISSRVFKYGHFVMLVVYEVVASSAWVMFSFSTSRINALCVFAFAGFTLSVIAFVYIVCVNQHVVSPEVKTPSTRIKFIKKRKRTESEKPIYSVKDLPKRKHHASSSRNSDSDIENGVEADEATT